MTLACGANYTLVAAEGGQRLDSFVAAALPDLSRTAVQRLIDAGQVCVNDRPTRAAYKVRVGDAIAVHVPPPAPAAIVPEVLPLDILYEDADILVVNKAAGMVVHPGAGNFSGTLVNALLAHSADFQGVGGALRPGIVHRLDKDTSGVLVVAKHDRAIHALQRQFQTGEVHKIYLALVIGHVEPAEGMIDAPIGRHRLQRQRMAVVADGKPARTRWRVRRRYRDDDHRVYTLLDVRLLTGRTHQIRVHFSWLGYPIVGDTVYGPARSPLPAPRQFLHARLLTLLHPTTGEKMVFFAPLPDDLKVVLRSLSPVVDAP
ncbi:MAG TPA: RluA family pseudouridine synthase [Anaerolineae bacterium]|nr:RluA family pseudouridine synthase [Anaerolineae bacterium]HQH38125.1 RluA family pseudouridine synthase [Anaerolineae bacterium]